jgi:hypothetical protein
MAYSTSIIIILIAFSLGCITCRPQFDIKKTVTGNVNNDWRNEDGYAFKWKGQYFTFAIYL